MEKQEEEILRSLQMKWKILVGEVSKVSVKVSRA